MNDKLEMLVQHINTATDAGQIPWEAASGGVRADLENATIRIRKDRTLLGEVLRFIVENAEGETLDSISADEFPAAQSALLSTLLEKARRQALKVDTTIDSLINRLRKSGP